MVSVTRVPSHFHPQWQFDIVDDQLRLVTGAPLEDIVPSRQRLTPTFVRNGAIYAFFHDAFRRTRSLYGTSATAFEMPQEVSINIDSLADWHAAEAALSRAAVTPAVA